MYPGSSTVQVIDGMYIPCSTQRNAKEVDAMHNMISKASPGLCSGFNEEERDEFHDENDEFDVSESSSRR